MNPINTTFEEKPEPQPYPYPFVDENYHRVKLEFLLDELKDALGGTQNHLDLRVKVERIVKKHSFTLAISKEPCSMKTVPQYIH